MAIASLFTGIAAVSLVLGTGPSVQTGTPTLQDTVNTLAGLCTTARSDFGSKAREAGWPYDMASGQRARDLPFAKVIVGNDVGFACLITFTMKVGKPNDVVTAVENWSKTGDPKSSATRNADGSLQVNGAGYLLRAEAGASGATIWVKLT